MDIELRGELMPIELPWQLRRFDRIHFEISNGSDLKLQAVGSFPTGPKIHESEDSSPLPSLPAGGIRFLNQVFLAANIFGGQPNIASNQKGSTDS